jgi:predicted  nucleic acid-binding Zn-ribbon protein
MEEIVVNESIIIDRNRLEEECASAPAYFDYWQNRESDLKTEVENAISKLGLSLRSSNEEELFSKYRIKKLTEGAISDVIKSDPEISALKRQLLSAESERKACEKKISMLDTLAKLHGQGYFAKIEDKPAVRSFIAESVKAQIKETIKSHLKPSMKQSKPSRRTKV